MKFIKSYDDSITRGVISDILKEIQDLRKELATSEGDKSILLELQKNNEIMTKILSKLEDISSEMEEMNKPWYSRIFCG